MEFTQQLLNVLEEQEERVSIYTNFTTSRCNHTQVEDTDHSEQKGASDKKVA